jgi:hypothetical protein
VGRLLALVAILVPLLTACVTINDVTQPATAAAGSTITVTLKFEASSQDAPDTAWLAVRMPEGWSVTQVTYSGVESGTLVPDQRIANDLRGNKDIAAKPGYVWWSGRTERNILNKTSSTGQAIATLKVGTNPGTFYLDYGSGTFSGSVVFTDSKYFDRPITVTASAAPLQPPPPPPAGNCQFVLGFKTLHDLIPDKVGDCKTNEYHNPDNGDGLQETVAWHGKGGLLVWRKADNWTAFTDGAQTWINGPNGLQSRANNERFSWEPDASKFPVVR